MKKNLLTLLLSLFIILFLFTFCKKDISVNERTVDSSLAKARHYTPEGNFTSDKPYNVNVIYFVSNDRVVNEAYEERLTGMLLDCQDFFGKWMKHWGYGENRSFGLLTEPYNNKYGKRAKIHVLKGMYDSHYYAYDNNGGRKIIKEIKEYYANNPEEKTSEHYFVISATNGAQDTVSVPFNGVDGYYGFALDYPGFKIEDLGKPVDDAGNDPNVWIGGMYHEFGHGLGLPHCGEINSEYNDPNYGTSMMGAGNHTYGTKPTYLTHSSAAILNNCQVFATAKGTFYYKRPSSNLKYLKAYVEDGVMHITGIYESNSDYPVTDVSYYHDADSVSSYHTSTWVSKPIDGRYFKISMPIDKELFYTNRGYTFDIGLHYKNGYTNWFAFRYDFLVNGVTKVNFDINTYGEYPKENWKVIDFSSEESRSYPGLARYAIDGDINTKWMSKWSSDPVATYPHYITIDMGEGVLSNGFVVKQYKNSRIKDYELKISTDGINWDTAISGKLQDSEIPQSIYFDNINNFRYFKFIGLSSYDGDVYGALSEIGILNNKAVNPGI